MSTKPSWSSAAPGSIVGRGRIGRRSFLQAAGGAAGLGVLGAPSAGARPGDGRQTVAVLGGGVAGLTVAHELAERGFAVTVYERKALGGKAISTPVPGTGQAGRRDLPGEHGHRGYFGFYRHLPDTLRRIPFPGNPRGVFDNLTVVDYVMLARDGGRFGLGVPAGISNTFADLDGFRHAILGSLQILGDIPPHEQAYLADRMLMYFTSCDERRFGQWEFVTWWDYLRAGSKSPDYQRLYAAQSQIIEALKAEIGSARTVGSGLEALFYSELGYPGSDGPLNRIMNAPTNDAWIDPWERYLRGLGVEFRIPAEITGLAVEDNRIAAARISGPRGSETVTADWFVLAVPLERAQPILSAPDLLAADPGLGKLAQLQTTWSAGIQFYLTRELPGIAGHIAYIDSPWKLVSISQSQFWREDFASTWGSGAQRESFSVVISDWTDTPGTLYGKPAKDCTPQQIADETWAQMKAHLNSTGTTVLTADLIESYFLAHSIVDPGTPQTRNDEPFFLNTVGSWHNRPTAETAIPNLFLASDYVRAPRNIDFASMETASEAARHAVNALLDEAGSNEHRAALFDGYRPPEVEAFKNADLARYRAGLPHILDGG
ncbi:hydroxysqualene dehydroxylase [Nocardia wallacei]|uniref:hydroxysqualene dehydroxylase n=1 Tax=Nocardia wallacei TaxID=480035 RepID=UPI0024562571|nr:FAD-dependent oxidoreductase [Nocardia wallacei]